MGQTYTKPSGRQPVSMGAFSQWVAVAAVTAVVIATSLSLSLSPRVSGDHIPEGKEQQIKNLLEPEVVGSWGWQLKQWWDGYEDDGGTGPFQDIKQHAEAMASYYNYPMDDPHKNAATLLPTVSTGVYVAGEIAPNCNNAPKVIANYFMCKFLHRKPVLAAVTSHNIELLGVRNGFEFASNQGLYTFLLYADDQGNDILDDDENPFPQVVYARFTFVYKKTGEGSVWTPANTKIIQHHSSKEPGLPAPADREQNIKKLIDPLVQGSWGWTLNKVGVTANDMDALYANDAELLPTVKKGVWKKTCGLHGGAEIKKYFSDAFLPKKPKLIAIDHQKVFFSPDLAMATIQGLYTFEVDHTLPLPYPQGTQQHVKARFTFVYRKGARDDWKDSKIILHHSSGVPSCPGDLTGGPNGTANGIVNWDDLNELMRNWGACPAVAPNPCPNADDFTSAATAGGRR